MTAPMEATEAQTILEGMKVEDWPGVCVLGCIDRRVTTYSQQVRALNLAAALVASNKVKAGEPTVVIGAGAAGLTCAAVLRKLGVDVIVLEAHDEILPLFRGGSSRWLHPGVYDWPLDGWDRDRAGLPLLDWEHGQVDAVRRQLEAAWATAGAGVDVRLGVGRVRIGAKGEERRKITWGPSGSPRTHTVILAVGFGLEATPLPTERRYWEADDLDHPPPRDGKRRKWLVSGCGDGALTDLFRLCIEGFQHDRILSDFTRDPGMEAIRNEIRQIEKNAAIRDPAELHDAYERLDAPWVVEALRALPARDEVKLAAPMADFRLPHRRGLAAQPVPRRAALPGGEVRARAIQDRAGRARGRRGGGALRGLHPRSCRSPARTRVVAPAGIPAGRRSDGSRSVLPAGQTHALKPTGSRTPRLEAVRCDPLIRRSTASRPRLAEGMARVMHRVNVAPPGR